MNNWFKWDNKNCIDYGIHVLEQPSFTLPLERATYTDVPGRSGSLVSLEGNDVYDDIVLTATCVITDTSNIPAIGAWLKGDGQVTFSNRQGGHYKARVSNQLKFEQILRGNPHRTFAINFRCKPFFYIDGAENIEISQSGTFIDNPHGVQSEPIITVYGTGDITLMVGQSIIELQDVEGHITLDSEMMEAYKGGVFINEKVVGDFPVLNAGNTAVSWSGNVSKVIVKPNFRNF